MRFVAAIAGVAVAILPLIFFWVGAQTFVRPSERGLALAMVFLSGGLLALSVALFFTPSVQRWQTAALLLTVVAVTLILIADRLLK